MSFYRDAFYLWDIGVCVCDELIKPMSSITDSKFVS